MKNKTRITLGVALYFSLCMFDYILNNTFNWITNFFISLVGMVIAWFVIEFFSNKK
ncbi:hypothetical protein SAMN05518683_1283 [Salibacterium halotolerans]|uniref:Uncharacterized protein n=1 Tax=Salibacterium halotolerans TaxID=1884432 RepID=A0A1I5XI42_9BACI|nr:hypothetical protein SAMN05518683_1283 [Salibacterium halotolerans]